MAYVAVESDEPSPSPLREKSATLFLERVKATSLTPARQSFWNVDYYQHHFDVDTKTVLLRCVNTLNPLSPTYTSAHPHARARPLLGRSGRSQRSYSRSSSHPRSPTPSTAVGLVYAYGIGVPVLLWGALRYAGISEGWTMVEAVTVWGYAMFVWIPVSILCIVPIALLRWVLSGIAFGLSGYFLVANVYPVLVSADQKSIRLLIVVVAVLHGVVALLFKVLFFSYYIDGNIGPVTVSSSIKRVSVYKVQI
ncbi:Yip1-domain-containing protein [Lactarius sanguifluus]|nr:Yip1-domain-containing protein [Lactarius sanguifluus]